MLNHILVSHVFLPKNNFNRLIFWIDRNESLQNECNIRIDFFSHYQDLSKNNTLDIFPFLFIYLFIYLLSCCNPTNSNTMSKVDGNICKIELCTIFNMHSPLNVTFVFENWTQLLVDRHIDHMFVWLFGDEIARKFIFPIDFNT